MKKYLAKMLRRAAQKLDPQEERLMVLTPNNYGTSATNVAATTWTWTAR